MNDKNEYLAAQEAALKMQQLIQQYGGEYATNLAGLLGAVYHLDTRCDFCGRMLPHWETKWRHKACHAIKQAGWGLVL